MDEDVPATFEGGSTTKVIPGEGTYTAAPDGTVTFVPAKIITEQWTGVDVKRKTSNGSRYTNCNPVKRNQQHQQISKTQQVNTNLRHQVKPRWCWMDCKIPSYIWRWFNNQGNSRRRVYTVAPDAIRTRKIIHRNRTGVTVKRVTGTVRQLQLSTPNW